MTLALNQPASFVVAGFSLRLEIFCVIMLPQAKARGYIASPAVPFGTGQVGRTNQHHQ
jgi:hypothetical protein